MSAEPNNGLEREIDRELKRLPELPAPRTLAPRVMAAIERRASAPWYRHPWPSWPAPARATALVALAACFAAACWFAWQAPRLAEATPTLRQIGAWLSAAGALWNALSVLLGAVLAGIKSLGIGFLAACLVAGTLGYAACLGLGAVYVRLAFART